MFMQEDNTYHDIREKSLMQWLEDMADYEDIAVRGGIPLAKSYIESQKKEIEQLKEQCRLKDEYLKKIREKYKENEVIEKK